MDARFPDPYAARMRREARIREREDAELDYSKANASTVGLLTKRVKDIENGLGAGFIDYSDLDAPAPIVLAENAPYQVVRNLAASEANSRLSGPWRNHQFWDNTAKLVRARALYDVVNVSVFIRVVPDKSGSAIKVSLVAGTIEAGSDTKVITSIVGTEGATRAFLPIAMRNSFVNSGAKLILTATAPMTILEISPEFYPVSYEL